MTGHSVGAQLTVVIPAWDVGKELAECIASVRADPEPCEIVVVDNASCRPLNLAGDLRVVRSDRRLTLGGARNLGLEQVATPYVCFMDADDVLLPPALQILTSVLRRDKETALAIGGILLWDPDTNCRIPSYVPSRLAYRVQHRRSPLALLQATMRVLPTAGAAVMRTSTLLRVGGFPDIPAGENWAVGVSLALAAGVHLDPRPMKLYRVHARRPMLSAERASSLREGFGARVAMRRALRESQDAERGLRAMSYLLAPVHVALAVRDRLQREPRYVRMLRERRRAN